MFGDFNFHNKNWLICSDQWPNQYYPLAHILSTCTRTHYIGSILTRNPEPYSTAILIPIERSDHALISVIAPINVEPMNQGLFDKFGTITMLTGTAYGNSVYISSTNPSNICQELTDVIHVGIETFIPNPIRTGSNNNRKPWLSRSCHESRVGKIGTHRRYSKDPTSKNH